MEQTVFPAPAVAGWMEKIVEARIHNDGDDQDEVRAWQKDMIQTYATPSYALVDPASREVVAKHEGPQLDSALFAAWLEESHERWQDEY